MTVIDRLAELERRVQALEARNEASTEATFVRETAEIHRKDAVRLCDERKALQNENAELRARLARVEAIARGEQP